MKRIGLKKSIPEGYLTTTQAAKEVGVTRQGLIQAIALGRLKALKVDRNLFVASADLLIYKMGRWNRDNTKNSNGELVYNPSEGRYSVRQAARYIGECLGIAYQPTRIYNLIKRGFVRYDRYHCAYIIRQESVDALVAYEKKRRDISE